MKMKLTRDLSVVLLGAALTLFSSPVHALPADNEAPVIVEPEPVVETRSIEARIKDIVRIDGLNSSDLIGYGIVIGLNGTGDKDLELTKQTMANLMQHFQIKIPVKDIKSKNVAVVMVTAAAPPFHRAGDRIDVQVSSIGDAASLFGGTLLMTPLLTPDNRLYALGQGSVIVGGYSVGVPGPGGQAEMKNHATVGIVPSGATLSQSQKEEFVVDGTMRLILRKPDFTTATRVAEAINTKFFGSALARDGGSILVRVPDSVLEVGHIAGFVADIETLSVEPDSVSKVVVNERTGTIVMGGNVNIGAAVIAHGNLTVRIGSTLSSYMPNSFTRADPVVLENVAVETEDEVAKVVLCPGTTTVKDLADMLNQLGTSPRDLISILEALNKLGALQMELVTM